MLQHLTDPAFPFPIMRPEPAGNIEQRYGLKMSPLWHAWFKEGVVLTSDWGEFSHSVPTEVLLQPTPEVIWPCFMLPDTLPILGNGYGDWLCLRVAADNTACEVLHWYHGGGDWMPWGRNPAEAIVFDRLRARLPVRRIGHSLRPEDPQATGEGVDALCLWSAEQLGAGVRPLCRDPDVSADQLFQQLIDAEVAFEALMAEQTLAALDGVLRRRLRADLARKLGIPWEPDAVRWMFDERLVPVSQKRALCQALDVSEEELDQQDWNLARHCCQRVLDRRNDLGWAWDIAGWGAIRSGDLIAAKDAFAASLLASNFSDQSIRFRTHWFDDRFGKFSAYQMAQLTGSSSVDGFSAGLLHVYGEKSEVPLRMRVYQFWCAEADRYAAAGDANAEYSALYHAGWDLGLDDLAMYVPLLRRMAEAADRAGQTARAAIARTHLDCLSTRFRR